MRRGAMDLELEDKIAVVTGASTSIGRGIAKVLAAEGVQIIVVARRMHLLETLLDEIVTNGGKRPLVIGADLYDRAVPALIHDQVLKCFGRADILACIIHEGCGGVRFWT